jgi:propionyl-CoA synthetase
MSRYHQVYECWRKDPSAFWAEAARDVTWFKPWERVFDPYAGQYGRWFVGAECNTAYNCLDRHVEAGRGRQKAIIYDSPVTNTTRSLTYAELTHEVATLAGVLLDMGIRKGDRVIVYMPMIPEAAVAMLACARIGAIHSVVFGGFAAAELATRIEDSGATAIIAASCGIEPGRVVQYKPLLDKAIEISKQKPKACLILQRPMAEATMISGRDVDWATAVADAKQRGRKAGCESIAATDPLYILYTSGTTGAPKGVVRDNGGHMVALKWSMAPSTTSSPARCSGPPRTSAGWSVTRYIVYAPLLHGATTVMYEGKPVGTPDAGAFWRMVEEYRVAALFTAPDGLPGDQEGGPGRASFDRNYDLSSFRTLFLAGERADPDTVRWAEAKLGVPVVDHWWQTETGWAIAANPVGLGLLPVKHGSPTVPMPGYAVEVARRRRPAVPVPASSATSSSSCPCRPPACRRCGTNDERFRALLSRDFPGYYKTSDAGYRGRGRLPLHHGADRRHHQRRRPPPVDRPDGGGAGDPPGRGRMRRHRRRRRTEGPGALRLRGAEGGRRPATRGDREGDSSPWSAIKIGPVAAFKNVITVNRLPKTRSGKILRGTMRQIADGETWRMPATIDDPAVLDEIGEVLKSHGAMK